MDESSNKLNTWDVVRKWRKELTKEDVENFPVLDGHNITWELLDQYYSGVVKRELDERSASNPLEAFLYLIEGGFMPPPEILLTLSECFNRYFEAGGALELEEIFFGAKKPSVGNYAARKKKEYIYQQFSMWIAMHDACARNKGEKTLPLIGVLESFCDFYKNTLGTPLEVDPESFLRSWRRWKKQRYQDN